MGNLNIAEIFKDIPEVAILFDNDKELYQKYLNSIFPESRAEAIPPPYNYLPHKPPQIPLLGSIPTKPPWFCGDYSKYKVLSWVEKTIFKELRYIKLAVFMN